MAVVWIERRGARRAACRGHERHTVFLQATPIDVAPILKLSLFDKLDCAVLTSATLAVGGGFDYMRQRLGLGYLYADEPPPTAEATPSARVGLPPELLAELLEQTERLVHTQFEAGKRAQWESFKAWVAKRRGDFDARQQRAGGGGGDRLRPLHRRRSHAEIACVRLLRHPAAP